MDVRMNRMAAKGCIIEFSLKSNVIVLLLCAGTILIEIV